MFSIDRARVEQPGPELEPEPPQAVTGKRPLVCIQGLGFVGTAMALATASAREPDGTPCFDVVGVELDDPSGCERAQALSAGRLPIASADERMEAALHEATRTGNLLATTDHDVYAAADVAIVDIPLDLDMAEDPPTVDFTNLRSAVRQLASQMSPGSLIVLETTVPPGTCEKVVAPEIADALAHRDLPADSLHLAHA